MPDMSSSNKVARVAEVTAGLATQVDKVSTTPLDYYDPMAIAIRHYVNENISIFHEQT